MLWCERQAVALAGSVLHVLATRIAGNEVLGCRHGAISALGLVRAGRVDAHQPATASTSAAPASPPGSTGCGSRATSWSAHRSRRGDRRPDGAGDHAAHRARSERRRPVPDPREPDQRLRRRGDLHPVARPRADREAQHRRALRQRHRSAEDGQSRRSVSIENNHLSDIGSPVDERDGRSWSASASRVPTRRRVAGNTISGIGQQAVRAPLRAGIAGDQRAAPARRAATRSPTWPPPATSSVWPRACSCARPMRKPK